MRKLTADEDDRQPPLRGAHRQALLRRAGHVHHRWPARGGRPRGRRGRRRRAPADRRDQSGRGRHGLDPRRLRARGHLQHGSRLRLRRVRCPRDRDLVPGPSDPRLGVAPAGGRCSSALGVEFEAVVPEVDELAKVCDPPSWWSRTPAEGRRRAGARRCAAAGRGRWGSTPMSFLDGRALGKAGDEEEARERLDGPIRADSRGALGGGSADWRASRDDNRSAERSGVARSLVTFTTELDEALLERYLASGEWRDRAGAYAIQGLGSILIERLEGDFSNVVGPAVAVALGAGSRALPRDFQRVRGIAGKV